ncbi:MAG: YwaF family protein [Oscillospiraceae bacterium]|nr:YwaF family protein [Oscillospiraceae bacterium]
MELWTSEHMKCQIPAMIAIVVISIALRIFLGKADRRFRIIPLQVIAVLLVLLEIGKQVVSFRHPSGYDLYSIPLHFCSVYLFTLPVMSFYKGKNREVVTAVVSTMCVGLLLFMVIYPNLIFPPADVENFFNSYMSFHTIVFHNLVLLATVLIFALDLSFPTVKGEKRWLSVSMVVFSAVAGSMAQILKTNFANFYSCNIPPVEAFRLQMQGVLGYGLTQTIYVLVLAVLHVLFMLGCYWLYRSIYLLTTGKRQKVTM